MRVMMSTSPPMQREWRPKLLAAFDKLEERLDSIKKKFPKASSIFLNGEELSVADISAAPWAARVNFLPYFRGFRLDEKKHENTLKVLIALKHLPLRSYD